MREVTLLDNDVLACEVSGAVYEVLALLGCLRSEYWQSFTGVLGQPTGPIFRGQAVQV